MRISEESDSYDDDEFNLASIKRSFGVDPGLLSDMMLRIFYPLLRHSILHLTEKQRQSHEQLRREDVRHPQDVGEVYVSESDELTDDDGSEQQNESVSLASDELKLIQLFRKKRKRKENVTRPAAAVAR